MRQRSVSIRVAIAGLVLSAGLGCIVRTGARTATRVPATLLGEFVDDYSNRYTISPSEWVQWPHGRFHIERWEPASGYLIARNDSANSSAPGRWTRIDWVALAGIPPYGWAFCLSAYDAPTAAAAEAVTIARRDTPRTGCNGFPFSRMRRRAADER